MEYWYTTTTPLCADHIRSNNLASVISLSEVESFTITIDKYIKFFGEDRASRLEKNLDCCIVLVESATRLIHRKLHYTPKKWWQFWKKKDILAVTLEVR